MQLVHILFTLKKSIPYSQALRLNRICSNNKFFDTRCNNLEAWLISRGYSAGMVRHEILKARKFRRDELLNREKAIREPPSLVFSVSYHPAFSKLRNLLSNIHLILSPNQEHQKVFPSVPTVAFKKGRSLKDILVRAKLPCYNTTGEGSKTCGSKRCKVCPFIECTETFENSSGTETYKIKCDTLDCNSENVVYLITCKTCSKQYVGSTITKFRTRFNNYKMADKYYNGDKRDKVKQLLFHEHFSQSDHHRVDDWSVTLIDQACNKATVRRKESFWQYKLDTFIPKGLNTRDVTLDFG